MRTGRLVLAALCCGGIPWFVGGSSIGAEQSADRSTPDRPDYYRATYSPLHFKPAIETATDEQCLACHQEILDREVLAESPVGVTANEAFAWYQTLDTYEGDQQSFHRRHLVTPYAQEVMNLQCNFCHQGNDPREEAPIPPSAGDAGFTLRKVVNPETTCLKCHGIFPHELMALPAPWHEARADYELEEGENGCLICHAELYRTVRHQVTYLQADAIEAAAQGSSDVCYGCHGGRSWYRISYPYPRHLWPGMEDVVPETPEWAIDRPTVSDARFRTESE